MRLIAAALLLLGCNQTDHYLVGHWSTPHEKLLSVPDDYCETLDDESFNMLVDFDMEPHDANFWQPRNCIEEYVFLDERNMLYVTRFVASNPDTNEDLFLIGALVARWRPTWTGGVIDGHEYDFAPGDNEEQVFATSTEDGTKVTFVRWAGNSSYPNPLDRVTALSLPPVS